jgi:hypothetical protein
VRRDLPMPTKPSPEEQVYFDDLAKWTRKSVTNRSRARNRRPSPMD